MNAGTLEAARLRHPAGSRLPNGRPVVTRPALRLVPALSVQSVQAAGPVAVPVRQVQTGSVRLGLRLTRRGRGVFLGFVLALMFIAGLAFGAHAMGADSRSTVPVLRRTMVVQPGESLWKIARSVAPGADPRDTVQRIIDANALPGAQIEAGRTLVLP